MTVSAGFVEQTCLCNCCMCNCCMWQAVWLTQDYGMRLRWSGYSLGRTMLGVIDMIEGLQLQAFTCTAAMGSGLRLCCLGSQDSSRGRLLAVAAVAWSGSLQLDVC